MLKCAVILLYKWQTLITGLLALLAAIPTVFLLHRQINLSERHERTRRQTQEAAARAVLPLTLSAIIDYAQQSSVILHSLYQNREGQVIPKEVRVFDAPLVPESAIGSLQSMIEASTNKSVVIVITKLINKIQIHNSRLYSIIYKKQAVLPITKLVAVINIEGLVIDTAMIHTLAGSLFSYARSESETPEEVSWDDVSSSLRLLKWYEPDFNDLHQKVASKKSRSAVIE